MFGMPVGRYFGGPVGPGAWVLTMNLQRKTPGPKVRVGLEPHPGAGTVVTLTTTENEAVARGYGIILAIWLGFLVLVGIPMAFTQPGPNSHTILPPLVLAFLVLLVLCGACVGVYVAVRANQKAGVVRARRSEVEHFVRSLQAVPT